MAQMQPPPAAGTVLHLTHVERLIGVRDETNEHTEDHVDEEGDEQVEVDLAEDPESNRCLWHLLVSHVHVISIEEGEEALRGDTEVCELHRGEWQGGGAGEKWKGSEAGKECKWEGQERSASGRGRGGV